MLKIKVGDKEYDLPDLDYDHWLSVLENEEKRSEDRRMITSDGVKSSIDWFYDLLNPYYPELTKKVLRKMPVHQGGSLFTAKIIAELMHIPLDSEAMKENQSASESSQEMPSTSSESSSDGPQEKSTE